MEPKLVKQIESAVRRGSMNVETYQVTAAKIATVIDQSKPDTITVPEAVEKLVEWAKSRIDYTPGELGWDWTIADAGYSGCEPSWFQAMKNGNFTDEAIESGLTDLFHGVLMEEKDGSK